MLMFLPRRMSLIKPLQKWETIFVLALYGAKISHTLDGYRYFYYNRLISNQKLYLKFNLAVLPPTSSSPANHSYCAYVQVWPWMDKPLSSTDWGWKMSHGSLRPITTLQEPSSSTLLNLVSCDCIKGCSKSC